VSPSTPKMLHCSINPMQPTEACRSRAIPNRQQQDATIKTCEQLRRTKGEVELAQVATENSFNGGRAAI
jgi:hypothetical protein